MGVPAFFRWLSQKYLNIITDAKEEKRFDDEGNPLPVDSSAKNPNGFEIDNLYLDMNGIIHPCTHPEDRPPPKNEDEMMENVYDVVDRLFLIARPRKILYLAVDGVAPRAKMNQQRSRRFRTVKDIREEKAKMRRIREEAIARGQNVGPEKEGNGFDSNCISPGTEFMHKVARTLAKYAIERLTSDPGFKDVKVIVSDASAPGEGEHKLVQFIRQQRAQPGYDPNTRHCISGLDADLIMLGLATHEPNFCVLREEVTFKKNGCRVCGKDGHYAADCPRTRGEFNPEEEEEKEYKPPTPYQFLHINVLREYLDLEFKELVLPFPYDLERVIDDVVFMCFFVGNDFLPHMPSLEIREGAIEMLMTIYKRILPSLGGYLTDNGEVIFERTKVLVTELGVMEDSIFVRRRQKELRMKQNQQRDKQRRDAEEARRKKNVNPAEGQGIDVQPVGRGPAGGAGAGGDPNRNAAQQLKQNIVTGKRLHEDDGTPPHKRQRSNDSTPVTPDAPTTPATPTTPASPYTPNTPTTPTTPTTPGTAPAAEEEPEDPVQLGLPGWRERYYKDKFGVDVNDRESMRAICGSYIEGLAWVLRYYYQGCCSWKWYFPYHFAPFAADVAEFLGEIKPEFALGTPFKPFEQLMGVLPPGSAKLVPKPYRWIMGVHESDDPPNLPVSPILYNYPEDFKIDMNGKKLAWQGVALLPFIEEQSFLDALKGIDQKITPAERNRNTHGEEMLFVNTSHPLAPLLAAAQELPEGKTLELTFESKGGIAGFVKRFGPLEKAHFGDIINSSEKVVGAVFTNPPFLEGFAHESKILPGHTFLPKILEFYGGEYSGGAGGLGGREGGYHHGQNYAANRMINNSLGANRQMKGNGMPIRGPGGGPMFVSATENTLPGSRGPPAFAFAAPGGGPLFPAGVPQNFNGPNQFNGPNTNTRGPPPNRGGYNNYNNGPSRGGPGYGGPNQGGYGQFNGPNQYNNTNQFNNPYNQYSAAPNQQQYGAAPNQYNNGPNQYGAGPNQYNNGPNQYGNGPNQYNNGPNRGGLSANSRGPPPNQYNNNNYGGRR